MLQEAANGNKTAEEEQTKFVVSILIEMQKLAESDVGLKHVSLQCMTRRNETPSERKPLWF